MKKFMVLYMAPVAEFDRFMAQSTPQQQKEGMDAWMSWMKANQSAMADAGAMLGKTKRVDSKGASQTRNDIGGYSIVQADSHDEAIKIFGKNHPHFTIPRAWIEIIEIVPMPEM